MTSAAPEMPRLRPPTIASADPAAAVAPAAGQAVRAVSLLVAGVVAVSLAGPLLGACSAAPSTTGDPASAPALSPVPPTRLPASSTAPSTSPPSSPASPSGPSRLVDHGDRESGEVALTFTVGYRLEPAAEILELLASRDVPATIFMSGVVFDRDETRADAERALRLIAERPDLFQLGQHGYSARELAELPADEIIAEVEGAERAMARYGIFELGPDFSPPGGAWSPPLLAVLGSLGYPTTVLWDVDPLDWLPPENGGPTAQEVAARVLGRVQGGSIVLLHLGGWNTLPALPAIIDGLDARELRPVTVADLLDEGRWPAAPGRQLRSRTTRG